METPPSVEHADCTECEDEDATFKVTNRTHEMLPDDEEDGHVTREVRCRNCKATGKIVARTSGLTVSGAVTHENAPWNSDSDEPEDSDE